MRTLITLCAIIIAIFPKKALSQVELFKEEVTIPQIELNMAEKNMLLRYETETIVDKTIIDVSNITERLAASTRVTLFIKGKQHRLENVKFTRKTNTDFTFKSKFGPNHGEVLLSRIEGLLYGTIYDGKHAYQIEPLSEKHVVLLRRDYSSFGICPVEKKPDTVKKHKNRDEPDPVAYSAGGQSGATPIVDVMVLFSDQASSSNMQGLSSFSVFQTNNTFSNSNVNAELNLIHYQHINYSESGYMDVDLNRMLDGSDGYMDDVHLLRNQYGADAVVLMVDEGYDSNSGQKLCGRVQGIEVNSNLAFAVVDTECAVGNITFAHEIGHLVGGRHDTDSNTSPRPYAHGFTNTSDGWRTVMAVYDPFNTIQRLQYWSNPDVTFEGVAMGTVDFYDNARVWDERAGEVAGFRSSDLSVGISGLTHFNSGDTGYWTASASGGQSPYSYTWYRSYDSSAGPFTQVGTGEQYSQTVTHEMWLKAVVTDNNNDTADEVLHVFVLDCDDPQGCPDPEASPVTAGPVEPDIPESFTLQQNFPNPFNPTTQISYGLPEAAQVSITVYDITGRQVAVLANGSQSAGRHTVNFQAQNLSSGMYIARIEAVGGSGQVFTRNIKMQLIK